MDETVNLGIEELLDIMALLVWEHGAPRIAPNELEQHVMELDLENMNSSSQVKLEMWVNAKRDIIEIISTLIKGHENENIKK